MSIYYSVDNVKSREYNTNVPFVSSWVHGFKPYFEGLRAFYLHPPRCFFWKISFFWAFSLNYSLYFFTLAALKASIKIKKKKKNICL